MLNTHIFKKGLNILAFKNIYAMYKSKYRSVLSIQGPTHLGSENINQIYIYMAIIMFYQVVSIDYVNYLVLLSILIILR